MGKIDNSARRFSVATVAAAVAMTNVAILMLCEISVQMIASQSAVFLKHAISLIVAAIATVVVEAVLVKMQSMSRIGRTGNVITGELTSTLAAGQPSVGHSIFFWWPVATWVVPIFLFWFANRMIGWEPSRIPYGMFFGMYLTLRILAVLRQK